MSFFFFFFFLRHTIYNPVDVFEIGHLLSSLDIIHIPPEVRLSDHVKLCKLSICKLKGTTKPWREAKDPAQPAHLRSLVRSLAVRIYILYILQCSSSQQLT